GPDQAGPVYARARCERAFGAVGARSVGFGFAGKAGPSPGASRLPLPLRRRGARGPARRALVEFDARVPAALLQERLRVIHFEDLAQRLALVGRVAVVGLGD